jgi:hypothetical protein
VAGYDEEGRTAELPGERTETEIPEVETPWSQPEHTEACPERGGGGVDSGVEQEEIARGRGRAAQNVSIATRAIIKAKRVGETAGLDKDFRQSQAKYRLAFRPGHAIT